MPSDPGTEIDVPPELDAALSTDPAARTYFESLAPSHRREYVGYVTEATKPETRARRSARTLEILREKAAKRSR